VEKQPFDSNLTAMTANSGGCPRTNTRLGTGLLILSGCRWTATTT